MCIRDRAEGEVVAALEVHEARIAEATLAERVVRVEPAHAASMTPVTLGDGLTAVVSVAKVTT